MRGMEITKGMGIMRGMEAMRGVETVRGMECWSVRFGRVRNLCSRLYVCVVAHYIDMYCSDQVITH